VARGDLQYQVGFDVDLAEIRRLQAALATGGAEAAKEFNKALGGGPVTKQIVFETRTDTNGVKQLVAVEKERLSIADAYTSKLNQIQKLEAGSVTSLRQQVNQAKQARDEIEKYRAGLGPLGGQVRTINERWAEQNTRVQSLQRSLDQATASGFWDRAKVGLNAGGLISFANGLTQITNGLQSASIVIGQVLGSFNQLTNALANLQQFKLAFEAVGAGASGSSQALNESSRIALGLGVNLATVRQGFQQLTPVILNSGGTIGDVSKITEALSSRFAAFGISGDRARRVMNGVIQAFAKGRLQAEELTQQISEADPAFKTDFAAAVNISVAELEDMVKAGEVTSEMLLDVIPRLGKAGLLFGRLGTTASDAVAGLERNTVTIDQVRNKFDGLNQLSLEAFAKQFEPVINSLFRIQASVVDFVANVSKLSIVQSFTTIFVGFSDVIGGVVSSVLSLTQAFLSIVSAITNFINPLLQIPGVAQTVGLVIISRLIQPLIQLKKTLGDVAGPAVTKGISDIARSFAEAAGAGSGFSQVLSRLNSYEGLNSIFRGAAETRKEFGALSREGRSLEGSIGTVRNRIGELQARLDANKERLRNTSGLMQKLGASTGPITREFNSLTKGVSKLEKILASYEAQLGEVSSSKALLKAALLNAGAATGFFAKGLALTRGLVEVLKLQLKELILTLGPLGAILIAATVLFSAFNNGNKETARIAEESKARLDALGQSTTALQGFTQDSTKPVTGLGLAWERLSLKLAQVGDGFGGAEKESKKLGKGLPPIVRSIAQFGATAGAVALVGSFLGAAAGSIAAGIGAIPGAVFGAKLGTIAGGLVGLASTGDGTAVSLAKLERVLTKSTSAVQAEAQAVVDLVGALSTADKRIESNTKKLAELNKERARLSSSGAPTAEIGDLDRQISQTKVEIQIDTTKAIAGLNAARDAVGQLDGQVQNLSNRQGAIEAAITTEKSRGTEANIALLNSLQKELNLVSKEAAIQKQELDRAKNAVNTLAAATGKLNEQQRALAPTFANLSAQIKTLQADLETDVDPFTAGGDEAISKIQALSAVRDAASRTSAELQRFLLNESLQTELTNIQTASTARIQSLNEELTLVRETANARIEALRELGPAEQALADKERERLVAAAATGDLQARAQLERLDRNKEIAAIEKAAAAEEKTLRAAIAAEEKAAREENLSIQRQLLALAEQEKVAKIEAAKAVLNERNQLGGSLEAANAASAPLLTNIEKVVIQAREMRAASEAAATASQKQAEKSAEVKTNAAETVSPMKGIADSAAKFNTEISAGVDKLSGLDGKTINVNIRTAQGLWTGGPTQAGQTYQVNELGQEGFLSSAGRLGPINKPKNALWRAPSSGTVIPAHIWSGLDVPTGGVRTNAKPMTAGSGGNGLQRVVRAIQSSLTQPRESSQAMHELTAVQARQAIEIGKLSRAVNKLANKDQSVNVSVRGNDATAYLGALNSRI
jgi:tape measure domain-containing protein